MRYFSTNLLPIKRTSRIYYIPNVRLWPRYAINNLQKERKYIYIYIYIQVHSKWHRCKTTRWRSERHFSFRYFSKVGYHDQGFWLSTLKSGVDTESCFPPWCGRVGQKICSIPKVWTTKNSVVEIYIQVDLQRNREEIVWLICQVCLQNRIKNKATKPHNNRVVKAHLSKDLKGATGKTWQHPFKEPKCSD